jgi:DNA-directed RNA polymerase subunit RPC12/RpoP
MESDIFNHKILCKDCSVVMAPIEISKNGFNLRAIKCPKCASRIIHPRDEQEFKNFNELKKKQFSVKMRFVGNSYAVSIPKEIVNFMQDQQRMVDDMVNLCLEEFGTLRMSFACNHHKHLNNKHSNPKDNTENRLN